MMARRILVVAAWTVLALLVVVQIPPLSGRRTNPPVVAEPAWDASVTRELAVTACFDCHSNETRWPWYSTVAPVSWLVIHDVDEGRGELNFSEWGTRREQADGDDAAEAVRDGSMPMPIYLPLHPEARLEDAERETLAQGLLRTLGRGEDDD